MLSDPRGKSLLVLEANGLIDRIGLAKAAILQSAVPLLTTEDRLAAVPPNGALLAVVHQDGLATLIDTETLQWFEEPSSDSERDVAYAPDGSQSASLEPDRIKLWNGRTGDYQTSIPIPNLPATGLWSTARLGPGATIAYLSDSTGLLAASADRRVFTVGTRTDTWRGRACRIAGRNLTRAEWHQFFPSRPYRVTCPQWPAGG